MSVRSRIAERPVPAVKALGGSIPAAMEAGEAASQMTPASPFGPGEPVGPYDGFSRTPRSREFVTGYNIATRPRTHEAVSFDTLKGLIRSYDVAQICIRHRVASIRSLDWKLIAADEHDGDVSDAIAVGLAVLKRPDRKTLFKPWLAKYLRDVLSYDAGTLYRMRNRAGRAIGLKVVDGTTIAPLLDYWGDSPDAPDGEPKPEAFVQFVNGLPWNWLTRDDLIYEPYDPQSDSIYGRSPLEDILLNANTDLRFQVYFLQRFTEGNIPEAFASAPETWSPQQIEQFQEVWDGFMLGDQSRKSQIRWIPGGSSFAWSNEKEFTDTFSLFLMRKTCASYAVVPSDIGFTEDVNRSSGESQADVQHRVGDLPLMEHVEAILSAFLSEDLGLPLQFQFDRGEEQDDQLNVAQSDDIYIKAGVIGASEVREMRFGLPEPEGKPVPRFIFSNRAGPIPLSSLVDVAGPVDAASGAPEPGAELPHKEFQAVEGVVPVPPPPAPALAERIYGPGAVPPPPPGQPVAKEGEGGPAAGITAETGVYGYDGPGGDDDEERRTAGQLTVADDPDRAAVAKEMAAFRRYSRARRKAGEWRDFRFAAVGRVRGHNLNDSGRLAIRKDAGEIAVAGLAVQAQDTGRVLMLQRALSDDDPAAGTWEFPGGHIEGSEAPVAAAAREWREETGSILPFAPEAMAALAFGSGPGWTSGIYAGFVYPVPSEDCVPVRSATQVTNPDDPDGDQVESIAWFDPAQLPGNPALRPELLADIDLVMAALGQRTPDCCGAECCAGGCCDGSGGCTCGPSESVAKAYPAHRAKDDVAKAGDGQGPKGRKGREWPGWRLAGKVTAHWAPQVTAAATGTLTRARLDRCAGDYLAAFPDQQGDAPGKRDRNDAAWLWLVAWLAGQGVTLDAGQIAHGLIADGYLVGIASAAAVVNGTPPHLGGWKPGDSATAAQQAAALGGGAALSDLLEQQGSQAADEISGGILGAVARALAGADGDADAADVATALATVIADEDLAAGLVFTQICVYTGMAAHDYYMASARGAFQWVCDPTLKNCPACLANAAADPRPLDEPWPSGDESPPVHRTCGCARVPADLA